MTLNARERVVLDRLKETYEANGYQFFVEPTSELLPKSVADVRPDAVAFRGDEKIIIELKARTEEYFASKLKKISNILESRESGWKLVVFSVEDAGDLGLDNPAVTRDAVQKILDEAEILHQSGHHSAALLLAWGGLEASARSIAMSHGDLQKVALGPTKIVDYLEQMGEILGADARELRRLVPIRNALSHGLYSDVSVVGSKESGALLRVLDEVNGRRGPSTRQ